MDSLAGASQNLIRKMFGQAWKFEKTNQVSPDSNSSPDPDAAGNIDTNIGYRAYPTTGIGSAVAQPRSYSGDSLIQLSSSGPYNLSMTFGTSPWI